MSAEKCEIIERTFGPVVEIEENCKVWQMPKAFGRDYEKINNYLVENDAECSGTPYARYVDMDWEIEINRGLLANIVAVLFKQWHFYAGLPSTKMLQSHDEMQAQNMEVKQFVRTRHKGPYKDVGPSYKALLEWSKLQGIKLKNEAFELYLNDPSEVKSSEIETEILIPLI